MRSYQLSAIELTYELTDNSGSELNLESHFTSEGSAVIKTFFYKENVNIKYSPLDPQYDFLESVTGNYLITKYNVE